MTRTPDPAAGAPRRRRGEPAGAFLPDAAGRPAPVAPVAGAGPTSSASPAPQLPGDADSSPAGVATPREGTTPAGSTDEDRAEQRAAWKRAESAQHAEQRRRATRYIPRSRKGVQAASGPGMVRRMPPPQTPGDAA